MNRFRLDGNLVKESSIKTSEFRRVFSGGNKILGKNIVLHVLSTQQENNKVGIIVKKSIGNAVQRNKIRRRLREIWRQQNKVLSPGYDMVIVARKEIISATFAEIEQEIIELLQRNNIKLVKRET
ncbi:MAG: ribonuclease P protein component [Candidatus Atribacteria bacterium]|nr:ribonuclease P protein component [Candidatus Atribacteria bacterium]